MFIVYRGVIAYRLAYCIGKILLRDKLDIR